MKLRYIKPGKLNFNGTQYRNGDILEIDAYGKLPPDWFEVIDKSEVIEANEVIEPKKSKKLGGHTYGNY